MCSLPKKFRTFRFSLLLSTYSHTPSLLLYTHQIPLQKTVLGTVHYLLLSRSSSYVNQSMGYRSDHKIWLHFYANLFTCISVP